LALGATPWKWVSDHRVIPFLGAAWRRGFDFPGFGPGALSPEAKLRATQGGGKYPPEAKSFGKSSAEDLKQREMPSPP